MSIHNQTLDRGRKLTVIGVLLLLAFGISCKPGTGKDRDSKKGAIAKRVLVMGLDGLSVEGFKTARTPHLDALFKDGSVSFTTRAVMPSVTLPNWTSHLTSSGPEQHGVDNNNWTREEHALDPSETDNDGYPVSVFKILKEEIPEIRIGYYYNWGNLINPMNRKYFDEVNFLEEDAFIPNCKRALDFMEKHRDRPSLVFLYNVATDHAGHENGWMTGPYITAIEEADMALGEVIEGLKSGDMYDDTHFILITDHGGINRGHGGMSPDEMIVPWAVRGPGIRQQQMTEPHSNTDTGIFVLKLFGKDGAAPDSWIGKIPRSVFK
ncbi:alkaline phosphatase family protein [Sinomicrobium soli]|uniref:alkaline phosphatase family protein n=1 Tax=Sinomicrobium sp. N-1-3-6 TaxID=2219864 RepID=UPI000DCBCD07|nr:alkaline phosphatase family protein [Sinomicrobium sp. N-1-3-6]RAV28025.1 nucleotide pyrophosphatase [Sinomicrobium sp. N-1-3-6]